LQRASEKQITQRARRAVDAPSKAWTVPRGSALHQKARRA